MGVGLSDGMVVETVSLVEADTLGVLVIESVVAGVGGSVVGPGVGKTELGGGGGEGGGGGGVIGRRVGVGAAVVGISMLRTREMLRDCKIVFDSICDKKVTSRSDPLILS